MSGSSRKDILLRHSNSLQGRLRGCSLHSSRLGITKPFYVYEPPVVSRERLPVLYLFRGHEREWVNFNEDSSRRTTTAVEDLDKAIDAGALPPMLVVMPGLNSANNHVPSLGINMVGEVDASWRGLGTGRFWDYLTQDLFPHISATYPQTAGGKRLAAGFSLGGYTVSLLAIRNPGFFDHVGIYDGLFMWSDHRDPRVKPEAPLNDGVWVGNGLFDAAFGSPRSRKALLDWNPTDALSKAPLSLRQKLGKTTWWISCAAGDGSRGNRDRAHFFSSMLKKRRLPLGFESTVLDPKAAHNWHWTDRFLIKYLKSINIQI